MKQFIICLLAIISINAKAQPLLIKYDFIKDKFTYLQNGKEVKQPTIHKNYEVKVLVENLNPFVILARCQWKETSADENASTSGLLSMFTGLGAAGTGGISSLLSGLNMKQFEEISSRGSNSMLESNLNAKMSLKNAVESYNQLFKVEQTINNIEFSTAKLAKMKFNPYLPADTLKSIAVELTAASMSKMAPVNQKAFSVSNFINFSTGLSNTLNENFDKLKNYSSSFLTEYNNYAAANSNFAESGMDQTVKDMMTSANSLRMKYDSDNISQKVEALEQQYESINYTPFTYACNYMATGDMVNLKLDFFQVSSASQTNNTLVPAGDALDTLHKIRSKSLNVMVHGDMKITTSIGLGFPTYFNSNKTWTNRDSLIVGSAGNNYAPCIATYVNFYPYMGRNLHLGGTFGVGIPVQSEGTSALNFFLGGSAVLGSSSKVCLHAGLAIGQLNVLAGNQKENDNLGDKVTQPTTKKIFKTGAFFGISFALNK